MKSAPSGKAKTVFDYQSYRDFLRDAYMARKREDRTLSMNLVGQTLGWGDFTTLSKIISGKRRLPLEKVPRVCAYFKLSGSEQTYFESLVRWNDFADPQSEKSCLRMQRRLQRQKVTVYQPVIENEFYIFVIIRMCLRRHDRPLKFDELARLLTKELSQFDLRQALSKMKEQGLVTFNAGFYTVPKEALRTENDRPNPGIRNYHRKMLYKAIQALEFPIEERQFSGRTLCVSKETIPELKAAIHEALDKIAAKFSDERSPDRELYQINFHGFPLDGFILTKDEK